MMTIIGSIIIPAYNAAPYIERCVSSILDNNRIGWRIVIVDDGSTDGTSAVCDHLAAIHPSITVLHQPNGGVSAARNAGIDVASGDWIAFVDADDRITTDALWHYEAAINATPDADFHLFDQRAVSLNGNVSIYGYTDCELSAPDLISAILRYKVGVGPVSKLYRKRVIDQHRLRFNRNLRIGEDFVFNLDYLIKSNAKCVIHSAVVYEYLYNASSAINGRDNTADYEKLVATLESYKGSGAVNEADVNSSIAKALVFDMLQHQKYFDKALTKRLVALQPVSETNITKYLRLLRINRYLANCRLIVATTAGSVRGLIAIWLSKLETLCKKIRNLWNISILPPHLDDIKVSIIVPVYNVEQYIRRCLDSLLAQTHRNIELVLVDDGATDGCGAIIDEYAATDSRIKPIHKKNGGVASARQAGINSATGDYIIHCDPDDWVECDMISELLKKAVTDDADVTICDYYIITDNECTRINQKPSSLKPSSVLRDLFHRLHGSLWNKLVKRACSTRYDLHFTPGINYCEDVLIWVQLFQHPEVKIAYLDKAFYYYNRCNSDSITRNYTPAFVATAQAYHEMLARLLPENMSDELSALRSSFHIRMWRCRAITTRELRENGYTLMQVYRSDPSWRLALRCAYAWMLELLKTRNHK